jgi:type IV pilus assembly protein PilW
MVSLGLGLLITGAAIGVALGTARSFRNDDALARMQENARHALQILAADLALADFWGEFLDPQAISLGAVEVLPRNDCGPFDDWAVTPQPALESLVRASAAAIAERYPCIRERDVIAGTDVLVVNQRIRPVVIGL